MRGDGLLPHPNYLRYPGHRSSDNGGCGTLLVHVYVPPSNESLPSSRFPTQTGRREKVLNSHCLLGMTEEGGTRHRRALAQRGRIIAPARFGVSGSRFRRVLGGLSMQCLFQPLPVEEAIVAYTKDRKDSEYEQAGTTNLHPQCWVCV